MSSGCCEQLRDGSRGVKEAAAGVQLGGSCAVQGGRGVWLGWGCASGWLPTDGGDVGVSGGADS